ncbi:MAG: helix-turn-helix transcriptional regulator [Clostridia bacterium]|nr:helix-turn-helix transcriptional regulator [Clostridia bacterium]
MKKILFDNNKNVISKQLKLCRVQNELTQAQLAAKMQTMGVNLDQQMISKIEHNTRFVTDYELACFCTVLKVTPAQLLGDFYAAYAEDGN